MILIIIVLLTLYNFARTTVYAENHKELPSLLAEEEALNFALLHVDNLLLNTKKPSSLYSMSRLFPFYEFSNGTVSENGMIGFFVLEDNIIIGTSVVYYNDSGELSISYNHGLYSDIMNMVYEEYSDDTKFAIIGTDSGVDVYLTDQSYHLDETCTISEEFSKNTDIYGSYFNDSIKTDIRHSLSDIITGGCKILSDNSIQRTELIYTLDLIPYDQGSYNWCGQCTSASIINYVRGLTYVPSYYNYLIHGSYYLNLGVTSQQVMNMASTYFNFTSLSEVNPISFIDATTEIINSRPIYMKWRRYDSEAKEYKYHANAMRGIMDVSPYRYYTLVNSWSNESYITLTVNSNPSSQTWSTGDRIYTWDKSIINWR